MKHSAEKTTEVIAWIVDGLDERGFDPDVSSSGSIIVVDLDGGEEE